MIWFLKLLYIHEMWWCWVEWCPLKIHIRPQPGNATWFEKQVFADVIRLSWGPAALPWAEPKRSDRRLYKQGETGQTRREKAMWTCRQSLELHCHNPRDANVCRPPPEAKDRLVTEFFPSAFRRGRTLAHTLILTSGLRNYDRINFRCVK